MTFDFRQLALAAALLLLIYHGSASACTCGSIKPCEAYALASVVFVGVAGETRFEKIQVRFPQNAMSTTLMTAAPITRFVVEEAFRGGEAKEVSVAGEGTTCDVNFKKGERYLVYAVEDPQDKKLYTDICGGTNLLATAKSHLDYLRSNERPTPGATLSGEIQRETYGRGKESGVEPIAKAEIIIESASQTLRAVADLKGNFALKGIPEGHYKIHTKPLTNFSRADVMAEEPRYEWEIDLPSHGCVQTWFLDRPVGEISGTMDDASGVIDSSIEIELVPADTPVSRNEIKTAKIGEWRRFRFSFLPPGRYLLGFNILSGPSLLSPYPEFYYPGVGDREKAKIITLAKNESVSGLSVQVPLRVAERILEGIATWPDGRPFFDHCGVQLINPRTDYREGNCVSTDEHGRFIIKAVEGQTYDLSASIFDGKGSLVSSKPVMVRVEKDNKPLKLVVQPR